VMDFGALPPDINSARMYAGPGSGPPLTAAAAWDGLGDRNRRGVLPKKLAATSAANRLRLAAMTSPPFPNVSRKVGPQARTS